MAQRIFFGPTKKNISRRKNYEKKLCGNRTEGHELYRICITERQRKIFVRRGNFIQGTGLNFSKED